MDFYKIAAQKKLRFNSNRGALTVEQLFDLPLTANNGLSLDDVSREVLAQQPAKVASLVTTANKADEDYDLRILILKDVIAHHTERARLNVEQAQQQARIEAVREELNLRKGQAIKELNTEQLEQELAALTKA